MLSLSEENYLKAIYHISEGGQTEVSTNAIAEAISTKPASVTDMIRKLDKKELVTYVKYKGVNITDEGRKVALKVIRKHRLWEVFLVDKLKFSWDEVHDVAEQLEHIHSPLLIERLEEFLGFPKYDPHGDPIPDKDGNLIIRPRIPLTELNSGDEGVIASVKNDTDPALLQYLEKVGASPGSKIKILDKLEFDGSLEVSIDLRAAIFISKMVAENLLIFDK
jgi:DtxR family transcriptional regulator, Mn-dependent transcriptional regulator